MRFLVLSAAAIVVLLLALAHPIGVSYGTYSSGEAAIGGAFALTGAQGKQVRDTDFRGRLMLVYMGYSHCPDMCPMTLGVLSELLKKPGTDSSKIAVLFISLDPARDTPKALAEFLAPYDPRIIGLTGSEADIQGAMQVYKVYGRKGKSQNTQNYRIDHSGFLYLMGRDGKYITHFPAEVKADELADAIKKAM